VGLFGHRLNAAPYPFWVGKRARLELAEQLAHAELPHGVTVNSVLPGIVEECAWETALEAAKGSGGDAALAGPPEVARIVARLCTEEFRWVTGSRIVLPGNLHAIR